MAESDLSALDPLTHKASQDTIISLMQLDPSPITSSPSNQEKESPKTSHPATSRSPSLGLSGSHGSIYYLSRIQRYSSYTFTFFAGLHFANTSLIPLIYRSVPYSEPFLLATRELYQTTLSEPLLVGLPVLAHVTSGLAIRLIRKSQNTKRYYGGATPGLWGSRSSSSSLSSSSSSSSSSSGVSTWPSFSNIAASGYVFSILMSSHVAMNRILPLLADGDSSNIGLAYVSHGFARHPASAWVAYALLLSVGAGHMVWGMARWMDLAPPANWKRITFDKPTRSRRRRAWWTVNGVAFSAAALWAAGGLGVVALAGPAQGWLGTVYDGIYAWAGR
ncbi:hypothetical protein F5Y16DRAFT_52369 [Xylariaceae sp. FL0255]|nr:hypothetical protein F5Y16DRAFT_52369 [Xylariaceae sp. FL0255]